MMSKRYQNGWWLEIKYWDEGLTQREIAEECYVSVRTVRQYMKEFDIPTRDISGENHPLYGSSRSEETKRKISESLQGRSFSEETCEKMSEAHEGLEISEETRRRISRSLSGLRRGEETRAKMSRSTAGEQNPNWKGGYSRRYGPGWSVARDDVRERDKVCQHCGHDGSKRRLEVHHIVPVRRFKESENVDLADAHQKANLVLLCRRCHVRADHGIIEIEPPDDLLEAPTEG